MAEMTHEAQGPNYLKGVLMTDVSTKLYVCNI